MNPWVYGPLAVLVALIPFIPLRLVSNESLARARDFWLLLMLGCASIAAALYVPPFAPIGVFFVWWWRGRAQLPSVVTWAALGFFFLAAGRIPEAAWVWIPWGWLAAGAAGDVVLVVQWWRLRPPGSPWWNLYRPFHAAAWWGQRTVGACFFALLLPFAPWWALPIPLLGLAITSSWAAVLAALCGAFVVWPYPTLALGGGSLGLGAAAWLVMGLFGNWRLLEYTPRGHSLDSLWQRLRVARLLLYSFTNPAWWPFGFGPRSMEKQVMRWASRIGPEKIPLGQVHNDVLHFVYEYGLCGVAAIILLAAKVVPALSFGDAYSGAVVAGVVLGLASIPFRVPSVGLLWLAVVAHVASR